MKEPVNPTELLGKMRKKSWVNEYELTLPSGNVAKVKRIDLLSVLVRRNVPDFLLPIVEKQINPRRFAKKQDENEEDSHDEEEMSKFMDWLCAKVFVEPRVFVEEKDYLNFDEEEVEAILTEDIALEDKTYILSWEMGGEKGVAAQAFRQQPVSSVASVQHSYDVSEVAI